MTDIDPPMAQPEPVKLISREEFMARLAAWKYPGCRGIKKVTGSYPPPPVVGQYERGRSIMRPPTWLCKNCGYIRDAHRGAWAYCPHIPENILLGYN